jgi:hypothetical protein
VTSPARRSVSALCGVRFISVLVLALSSCAVAVGTSPDNAEDGAALRTMMAFPALPSEPLGLETPAGFDPYIYRPSGERADPINIIFLHTDAPTAGATAQRVLGWPAVIAGGMSFKEGNGVRPTSRQLALDLGPQSRYHMRIQSVPSTDTQTFVLASVHRDDTAACGHVGRAFDEMRDLVARNFAEAGYPTRIVDLGNTESGPHCDGSRVAGDGRAVLIDLSRAPRVNPAPAYGVAGAQ